MNDIRQCHYVAETFLLTRLRGLSVEVLLVKCGRTLLDGVLHSLKKNSRCFCECQKEKAHVTGSKSRANDVVLEDYPDTGNRLEGTECVLITDH